MGRQESVFKDPFVQVGMLVGILALGAGMGGGGSSEKEAPVVIDGGSVKINCGPEVENLNISNGNTITLVGKNGVKAVVRNNDGNVTLKGKAAGVAINDVDKGIFGSAEFDAKRTPASCE